MPPVSYLPNSPDTSPPNGAPAKRHALFTRLTHWLNLIVLLALLGSGLQIFNAHPALYWGSRGSEYSEAWLSMTAQRGDGELRGVTRLFGKEFDTTGLLGASRNAAGVLEGRGFPTWATIPSNRWLAMGRRWHFFFAWLFVLNGLAYVGFGLATRHFSRDVIPGGGELKGIGRTIRDHLSIRRLRAESEHGYNTLQKISYLLVVFFLAPLVVLTGLTMSPWLDTAFPALLTLFDGRQSARALHFLAAFGFVLFAIIHVAMVLLVGPVRHVRAMITGRL